MIETDVLIIGGGPSGSACAWRLKQHHLDCLILDQQVFPRFKPCAGWITPEILQDLNLRIADYPYSFTTFRSFKIALGRVKFTLPALQYAIRRFEFDHWLLQRSGAPVHTHTVKTILRTPDGYIVDGQFSAKYLVGAGGTHCPVQRTFFETPGSRLKDTLIVAQEEEFPYSFTDPRCYLWFFENHLPGYAWYVPKANGYLNVGVGGKAAQLKANGDTLKNHWNFLVGKLEDTGLVRDHDFKPSGHSYYLRQRQAMVRKENAFLVGDSAGLATLDMGEGISPAVKSGLMAADSIACGSPYSLASIPRYSFQSLLRMGIGQAPREIQPAF
jgi:menaquinone-9 beta-reductase